MTPDELDLLGDEIAYMAKAADYLRVSFQRCRGLFGCQVDNVDEQERLEALASRFARLSDILIQRVMRLVDDLELLSGGTLLDRLFQAEKRGWVASADTLIRIRRLRNTIAHDYATDAVAAISSEIEELAPELLMVVTRVEDHASALIERLRSRVGGRSDIQGN